VTALLALRDLVALTSLRAPNVSFCNTHTPRCRGVNFCALPTEHAKVVHSQHKYKGVARLRVSSSTNAPCAAIESGRDEVGHMAVLLGGVDAVVLCISFQTPSPAPVNVSGPDFCKSGMSPRTDGGSA
jgi:phage FluMu protein Com